MLSFCSLPLLVPPLPVPFPSFPFLPFSPFFFPPLPSFFSLFLLFFLMFIFFIQKAEKGLGQEVFYLLVHSPSGCNGQGWARLSQEFQLDLLCGCRGPRTWPILHCLLRPSAGSWPGRRTAWTRTSAHMGCQHYRR